MKVKVTKPATDEALITWIDQDGNEKTYLETNATKANAATDALTAADKLGVWLP